MPPPGPPTAGPSSATSWRARNPSRGDVENAQAAPTVPCQPPQEAAQMTQVTRRHGDLPRRLRGRAEPEPRAARSGRASTSGSPAGCSRSPRTPRRSSAGRGRGRLHHGPQHVRPGPRRLGPGLEGLVGRRAAVPRAGVRAHPPRARAAGDGGRDDVPLRHGRDRGGAGAGARGRRRPRRVDRGRRRDGPAVPGGRPRRRAAAARRAGRARPRRAAARGRGRHRPRAALGPPARAS